MKHAPQHGTRSALQSRADKSVVGTASMKIGLTIGTRLVRVVVSMGCGAGRANATLIVMDLSDPGQTNTGALISRMTFEGGEANLFFRSSGLYLDILRFGDGDGTATRAVTG